MSPQHRVPAINIWNRGTKRKPNYYVRYSVDGTEYKERTGARTQVELKAFVEALERRFRLGLWKPNAKRNDKGALPFSEYARIVIARRVARGVKGAADDESAHVERHLVPMFGNTAMRDFTFVMIRDGFRTLIDSKVVAPKTIHNIHTTLRAILIEAAEDEIFPFPPPPLTVARGHLPVVVDSRGPGWRKTAHFTREEISALLVCDAIETQYRVMYATYFLTSSRFNEVTPLHVRDYDRELQPLASFTIKALKTKRNDPDRYRVVPVHPDLARWLNWWLDSEFEVIHGRPPRPDDVLFPTLSIRRAKRGETICSHGEIYKRWQRYHLPKAGLRHRRLHDARRTFISVVRSTTRNKDAVRAMTHTTTGDKVMDAYTDWEWQALCAEISAVTWGLPPVPGQGGNVVRMPRRERMARLAQ